LGRAARSLLTIFISVTLTFFIVRAMPSNPVELLINPYMSQETQDMLMQKYGLDKPLAVQYALFLKGLLQGDLGVSFSSRQPVAQVLLQKLPWTLLLIAIVMALVLGIGIPTGLLAARRRGKLADQVINVLVTLGISIFIPFLSFMFLYIFSYLLKVLPTGGAYTPPKPHGLTYVLDVARHAILPAATLAITNLANVVLYTRNSTLDVLGEDYVRTARAKGASPKRAMRVHVLRNAMIPTVTVVGLQVGVMVGGAVVTETIFAWPGIGRMLFEAIGALDYPILQGGFLLLSVSVVTMNFITDMLVGWLDPRIRLGGGRP
jgi:peptide/nickel transport system permease protein